MHAKKERVHVCALQGKERLTYEETKVFVLDKTRVVTCNSTFTSKSVRTSSHAFKHTHTHKEELPCFGTCGLPTESSS